MSDLAYADDIVLQANNYRGMQSLLETVNISMHINASKTKVMLALIPGEQHQAVLLEVDRYLNDHLKRPEHRRDQKQG